MPGIIRRVDDSAMDKDPDFFVFEEQFKGAATLPAAPGTRRPPP